MIKTKGHTIQWSRQKDIQYNDQDKRTYNTMVKTKGTKRQAMIGKTLHRKT
jgi:hypothetical protein